MASEIDINEMKAAKKATEATSRALQDQTRIAGQLSAAYAQGAAAMNRMEKGGSRFGGRFAKEMSKSGSVTKALSKALKTGAKDLEKAGKKAAFMAGAMRGAAKAVEMLGSAMGKIKSVAGSLLKSFIKLNIELMMAPLKITDALMKMANEAAKAGVPVAQASQNLAENFGSQAKLLRKAAKSVGALEKKYGNMTAYMSGEQFKIVGKAAEDMGDTFFAIADDAFGASAESMIILSKVLGFGKEEMAAVGMSAIVSGQSVKELESQFTQLAYGMQSATGVAQKVIAKDMAGIMGDVKNFASTTYEQSSIIAARLRTLGMSFKTLGKITDKFMNFDSAAESAAKLGQAFGMALNPMRMMKDAANDPLKNLENLRKSMFAAGKSSEKMNAAQLRLLASQTGLSEEEAKLMFAQKNRGKSVKDLKKTQKKQLSDAKRMENAVKALGDQFSKLIEVLTEGGIMANIQKGMSMYFNENPRHLRKFQKANQQMLQVGRKLGEAIGKALDAGVFEQILSVFEKLPVLMDRLLVKGGFFDKLVSGDMAGAFKDFSTVFEDVFGIDLKLALDKAGSYFVNFAASIVEKMATALENLGGPKSQGATAKAFSRLGAAWKRFFVALWPHIKKLLAFLMSEIWAWMKANPGKAILIGMLLMGNMFGPTVLLYAASALVGGLYGALKGMGGSLLKVGRYIGGKLVSGVKGAWKGLKGLGSSLKKMVTKPFRRGKMYKGGQFMKGGGRAAKGGQMAGRGRFAKVTEAGAKGLQKLKSAGSAVGGKFPKITAGLTRMGGAIAQLGPLAQKAGGKLASLGSKAMSAGKSAIQFGAKWGGKAMSGLKTAGSTIAKFSPTIGRLGSVASGASKLASKAFGTAGMAIGGTVNSIYEGVKGFGAAAAAGGNWADKLGGTILGAGKGAAEAVDFMTFGLLDKMTGFNGAFENLDFGYIGETFSYMGKEAWQGTKDFFGGIGDSISNGWTAIGGAKAVSKLKEMGGNLVNGIKDGWNSSTVGKGVNKMAKSAGSMISKAGGWLKKKFSIFSPSKYFATAIGGPLVGGIVDGFTDPKKRKALIGGAKTLFSKVGKFFSGGDAKKLLGKGLKMGKDLVMGIVSGSTQKKALKAAVNGMATVGKKIYGGFKSFFKISSPSKLMEEGGADIIGGLTNGVDMAVKAMDLITPEIAEKLGFGKDGNLTPEAKAAQEALKSSSDILNSVMDMITNLNDMGKIAADFDPVLIQGKMTIIFAKLEDAFLGPDGILEKQAALQKKIAAKVKEIAMRGKTYRKYNREEFRAVRDGWADSNTHGVKFDRQSAIQQAQTAANKKSEATAMDAFNAQGDLMNTQMGGLGDLLGGMTGMIEEANKLDKLSKDFDFDKIDTAINTLSNGALGLAMAVNTYFIDNKDAFDMSLSLKMIKDELIPGISTFNSMFKKDFLKDYSYDVYKKRIRWAKNLQGQIKSLTSEIAVINTMVNGIPDIELKATIDDVEDSMSIVKEFTKIKDKPINLNFNLQISMDANNLAQVILETETGSTIMRNK